MGGDNLRVSAAGGDVLSVPPAATRSPGRPPVPISRIVGAALEIIDDEGLDALSMRSLAKRLNSSTATLYRHFPTRVALIQSVIDQVLGEVDVDPDNYRSLTWRQGCEKIGTGTFEAFRRHRQTALLLADHTPVGPNAAAVRERTLAVLIDGGLPVPVAARSGAMIGHLILGFAIQLGGERDMSDADRAAFRKAIHGQDLTLFPATAAVKKARWKPTSIAEEFAFALEMVLDGLSLRIGRAQT
jgi:TetR/AcrR family transcriptional regulator, tetracycline repressor protein